MASADEAEARPGVQGNSFFILQESTLNYASNLLSPLHESGPPVVMHRFGHATSAHDSFTGEAEGMSMHVHGR